MVLGVTLDRLCLKHVRRTHRKSGTMAGETFEMCVANTPCSSYLGGRTCVLDRQITGSSSRLDLDRGSLSHGVHGISVYVFNICESRTYLSFVRHDVVSWRLRVEILLGGNGRSTRPEGSSMLRNTWCISSGRCVTTKTDGSSSATNHPS